LRKCSVKKKTWGNGQDFLLRVCCKGTGDSGGTGGGGREGDLPVGGGWVGSGKKIRRKKGKIKGPELCCDPWGDGFFLPVGRGAEEIASEIAEGREGHGLEGGSKTKMRGGGKGAGWKIRAKKKKRGELWINSEQTKKTDLGESPLLRVTETKKGEETGIKRTVLGGKSGEWGTLA